MNSVVERLLESYVQCGGIKNLNGHHLPSKNAVAGLTDDLLRIIFPGFIADEQVPLRDLPHEAALRLSSLQKRLMREIKKSLTLHPLPRG